MRRDCILVAGLFALASCSAEQETEPHDSSRTNRQAQSKVAASKLDTVDLTRVCKAAQAFSVGRPVEGIDAAVGADEIVRLSYTRDDGKSFEYDCKVEGDVVRTRMIDEAGLGSGPGAWSGSGSTATFKLEPGSVRIRDVFFDGSVDEGTIKI